MEINTFVVWAGSLMAPLGILWEQASDAQRELGTVQAGQATALVSMPTTSRTGTGSSAASPAAQWAAGDALAADGPILTPVQRPADGVEFAAVADLKQQGDQAIPQLRRGYIANPADWPASLYATFETDQGTASCTAALIGPQVLLTAAHCVPANGKVNFSYAGKHYATDCVRHPQYETGNDASADYALCKLNSPFAEPAGFRYETVDLAPMLDLLTRPILLTGYGCRSDVVAEGDADGNYRYGFNTVVETSASEDKSMGAAYYTPAENNNLFTALLGANLCPGDSGGPAFRRTNTQGASILGRMIIGVNSRVFYADISRTTYSTSLVSSTGTPEFGEWAGKWLDDGDVQACGLRTPTSIPNCRF
ncbi:V8-like Glu-specific endopeptidase [Rhizobium sp. BK077]|uniref:S1 family peptidase n=1 Tax=unclassified Rhizobium TaxID=2613769 RepID=UPI00160CF870|nr:MULTISPECIES: S1 family peptidase [unclassified Rhizobium]MBB3303462.1 V8-like Glu-specific endopeptidase [Rhizobium sp. BK112]MBB3372576.1 V8-like Glu-specific endopeptidase [Rhizobium sp. BK077]MBB4183353.1 V8-like Glu-specific endopeptidase [Rhizobium sp. BK109]